jgi:16S rRNA (guanine966-N2)-methyltransferase
VAPDGRDVRPTPDRVRESMFNALQSLDAIDGARVLDLFAGSGALGIEALSRGAAHATFVERDRNARTIIETNLRSTGLVDRATVVGRDAASFLVGAAASPPFDLALLDPPYAFDDWDSVLSVLPARTIVVESDRVLDLPSTWGVVRSKWYGSTLVVIAIHPE